MFCGRLKFRVGIFVGSKYGPRIRALTRFPCSAGLRSGPVSVHIRKSVSKGFRLRAHTKGSCFALKMDMPPPITVNKP